MNHTSLRVAGIDVSRGSITVVILDRLPKTKLKTFIKDCTAHEIGRGEIERLLELEFDAAVMEPTGGHYSRLWAEVITRAGRQVRWVGHREVHGYRESWRLPDKTDKTDAVALACYGLERWEMEGMFLDLRGELARELRERYLEIQFWNRATAPFINRLRQQLEWECPEIAAKQGYREWLARPCGLWRAVAGEPSRHWAAIIERSKGLGLGALSRELAGQILAGDAAILRLETEVELLLQAPEITPYLEAMAGFHFGRRAELAILGAVYPIEKFKGHRNPLGAFKLSCGLAQVWISSGDYVGWAPGGDAAVRKALWLWAINVVPLKKTANNAKSPELEALRDYYYNGCDQVIKEGGEEVVKHFEPGKGSQRLMRCVRRALTMLYRKLKTI